MMTLLIAIFGIGLFLGILTGIAIAIPIDLLASWLTKQLFPRSNT